MIANPGDRLVLSDYHITVHGSALRGGALAGTGPRDAEGRINGCVGLTSWTGHLPDWAKEER